MVLSEASDNNISAVDAILSRRSVRAFLPDPVPRSVIERILALAGRAPSGSNIQPWQVVVVTGDALESIRSDLHARALAGDAGEEDYAYYPRQWREPYLARRRATGWGLYSALGIRRGDSERMARQQARNYLFFDAPVGMIFTIDRDMVLGSWLDYGMFLQTVMIAARAFGLATCAQAAFTKYHRAIRDILNIPGDRILICGMALGYPDAAAPENGFATTRIPLDDFVRFVAECPVSTLSAGGHHED